MLLIREQFCKIMHEILKLSCDVKNRGEVPKLDWPWNDHPATTCVFPQIVLCKAGATLKPRNMRHDFGRDAAPTQHTLTHESTPMMQVCTQCAACTDRKRVFLY
jgi:hypothetical protein